MINPNDPSTWPGDINEWNASSYGVNPGNARANAGGFAQANARNRQRQMYDQQIEDVSRYDPTWDNLAEQLGMQSQSASRANESDRAQLLKGQQGSLMGALSQFKQGRTYGGDSAMSDQEYLASKQQQRAKLLQLLSLLGG